MIDSDYRFEKVIESLRYKFQTNRTTESRFKFIEKIEELL